MLKIAKRIVSSVSLTTITACSTMPLPEDRTDLDTIEIVQKIRCEARDSVNMLFPLRLSWIKHSIDNGTILRGNKNQELREKLGEVIKSGFELSNSNNFNSSSFENYFKVQVEGWEKFLIDPVVNSPEVPDLTSTYESPFRQFAKATILYEFDFEITEDNNNSVDANATAGLKAVEVDGVNTTTDSVSANVKASANRQRINQRTFKISDTARKILTAGIEQKCQGFASGAALGYPIEGDLGLNNSFNTFFRLKDEGLFVSPSLTDGPKFTDKMTFTTTLSAGFSPKVTLNVGPVSVGLSNATFGNTFTRKDIHTLSLVLTAPTKKQISDDIASQIDREWCKISRNKKRCKNGIPNRAGKDKQQSVVGTGTSILRKFVDGPVDRFSPDGLERTLLRGAVRELERQERSRLADDLETIRRAIPSN